MKQISERILDKKCFIFDIDGTLVDSMGMWNLVDQTAIFNASGQMVEAEEIKALRDSVLYAENNLEGNIYDIFYAEVIEQYGLGISVDEYKQARHNYAEYISTHELDFKPGAGEFLQIIKMLGKKIGIATTTTQRQLDIYSEQNEKMKTKASLKKLANVIIACEDVTRKKPDPEAYLKVVERLGVRKQDCIVFEDSLSGAISAKEAGLEVVAVYDESAKGEQYYLDQISDYKIESFDEIIKALGLELLQEQIQRQ